EVNEEFRKEILKKLKNSKEYRTCSSPFILYWPLYKMSKFDAQLKGKEWKKIRNIRNRFYRQHKAKVVDSKKVSKEELKKILYAWLKRRNAHDRVEKHYFVNLIENKLKGTEMAKTLIVDNKPCSITAGWRIPNSNNYYSHIGILDYSCEGLGEVTNTEDLKLLKRKNYDYVDFGGSDKVLLYFKKKFKPERIYKTYIFSIVRK
ncbi:MAG: phosphatidylglycerol lysyltransferase domain-containing protein, partial [Candidatus Thorarchaeota archaeon]